MIDLKLLALRFCWIGTFRRVQLLSPALHFANESNASSVDESSSYALILMSALTPIASKWCCGRFVGSLLHQPA